MSVKVYRSGPYRQYNQNADGAVIRNGHSMSVPSTAMRGPRRTAMLSNLYRRGLVLRGFCTRDEGETHRVEHC